MGSSCHLDYRVSHAGHADRAAADAVIDFAVGSDVDVADAGVAAPQHYDRASHQTRLDLKELAD